MVIPETKKGYKYPKKGYKNMVFPSCKKTVSIYNV